MWNNRCLVKWYITGDYSDGNGLIIDDSKNTQSGSTLGAYTGRTLITDNVSFNNGGSGIHVYESQHVDIVNNTAFSNGTKVDYAEIYAMAANDVRIMNNIMFARTGGRVNSTWNNTNVTYDYNIYWNGSSEASGSHDVVADPKFALASIDPAVADFHLQAGSPALDNGTVIAGVTSTSDCARTARPQGAGVDRGAYERTVVVVPPANQAPTANAGANASLNLPTSSLTLNGTGSDTDGSIASFGWTVIAKPVGAANPSLGSATSASTSVGGLVVGSYTLRLTVIDNQGATGMDDVVVTVAAAPDTTAPPWPVAPATSSTSSAMPTLSGTTEAGATVRIYDGTTQIGSATANGSGAWTFTVSPALAVGSHNLTVTATDAAGNVSTSSPATTVTVPAAPVTNTAPTISTVSNQTITEDAATAALAVTVGDAETAASALTLIGVAADTTLLPGSGITLGGSGANRTVTLTPAADRNGSTVITLTVGDGTTTTSSTFTLNVTPVNDAPRLGTSLSTVTGEVGIAVDVILPAGAFVDVDGDALTWALSSLPAGLTFDPATRRLSGTPTTAGDTTVVVTARDPAGLPFTQSITVRVLSAGTTAGSGGSGSGPGAAPAPALTPTTSSGSNGCGLGGGVGVVLLGVLALIAGNRRRCR